MRKRNSDRQQTAVFVAIDAEENEQDYLYDLAKTTF